MTTKRDSTRRSSSARSTGSKRKSRSKKFGSNSAPFTSEEQNSAECLVKYWRIICLEENLKQIPVQFHYGKRTPVHPLVFDAKMGFEGLVLHMERDKPVGKNISSIRLSGGNGNRPTIVAVTKMAAAFRTLRHIELPSVSLDMDGLSVLVELVKESRSVRRLTLDSNPLPRHQYHTLILPPSKLEELSLKSCYLDDTSMRGIARALVNPNIKLKILNLNFNLIDDRAAALLAKGLKWNRTVASLSLMGNMIRNKGCKAIANAFQVFRLDSDEINSMRRKIFERVIKKYNRIEGLCGPVRYKPKESTTPVDSDEEAKPTKNLPPHLLAEPKGEFKVDERIAERAEETVDWGECREGGDRRCPPIVADVQDTQSGLTSPGNGMLQHLDLSYNRIGEEGIACLLSAITFQDVRDIKGFSRGLAVVDLEGNKLEKSHPLMLAVQESLDQWSYLYEEVVNRKDMFKPPRHRDSTSRKSSVRSSIR